MLHNKVRTELKIDFVIVSVVRNEKKYIADTIQSIISQTVLPRKWIVINDGSTDGTDRIIKQYMEKYHWISLCRMPEHPGRHFAAKARGVALGYRLLHDIKFDIIGNIDADVIFEKDYFAFILQQFTENPDLGVAGTPFLEESHSSHAHQGANFLDAPGQCQFFRRECFEAVGGYLPLVHGGIDTIANTTARMLGWQTGVFPGKHFVHARPMGTAGRHVLIGTFLLGQRDCLLGNHPLWEGLRVCLQLKRKPYVLRSIMLMIGYVWCMMSMTSNPIPRKVLQFRRREQMQRLKVIISMMLHRKVRDEYFTS